MKLSLILKNIIFSMIIILSVFNAYSLYTWSIPDVTTWNTIYATDINRIRDYTVPQWAVMAFNLASCPTGWSEYTPAYGRFIRWIDKSGTSIDPDGQRALGNTQTDELKSHTHNITANATNGNAGTTAIYSSVASSSYTNTVNIQSTGWLETRPKNVALLYCSKN